MFCEEEEEEGNSGIIWLKSSMILQGTTCVPSRALDPNHMMHVFPVQHDSHNKNTYMYKIVDLFW
jgi:hypothetical protein